MDKIIKLLTLDSLRGIRTKVTLIVDAILYVVALLAPEFLSVATWEKLQPLFITLAGLFGVEHFEKKNS